MGRYEEQNFSCVSLSTGKLSPKGRFLTSASDGDERSGS